MPGVNNDIREAWADGVRFLVRKVFVEDPQFIVATVVMALTVNDLSTSITCNKHTMETSLNGR